VNVVFDFGGVLFHWRPHDFLTRRLPHHAPTVEAAERLVRGFFEGYGGDWSDFDRGTVEPDELALRIARRTGLTVAEARGIIDAVPEELTPMPGTVALLRRLHAAGHALYFLSNMPAPYAAHLEQAHDFVGLFKGGVFSARVRLLKPEPEIYAHALAHFGIVAGETVFIDDLMRNIVAARAAGWQGVHFVDAAQCEADLRQLGCHVP
jgi:putative hydrolase of the HAD superfamily